MGGVASYLTPSVRVLCSLLVPFLRCVQLPMLDARLGADKRPNASREAVPTGQCTQ